MSTPYEKAMTVIESEHKIVNVVFSYIDRMNDICDSDPAEKILAEFVAEITPVIDAHLKKNAFFMR